MYRNMSWVAKSRTYAEHVHVGQTNEHQLWECVWHVHIKYQMLPRGSDLVMIIGSKLQNKCAEFKNRPSPASSEDVMTLLHTPRAQCDIHTNQIQSLPRTHLRCLTFPFQNFHFLFCDLSRFLERRLMVMRRTWRSGWKELSHYKSICSWESYFLMLLNC